LLPDRSIVIIRIQKSRIRTHSPNGVVWITLLGLAPGAPPCRCLAMDALCRWSRLSVEAEPLPPFLMEEEDRTLTDDEGRALGQLARRGAGDDVVATAG